MDKIWYTDRSNMSAPDSSEVELRLCSTLASCFLLKWEKLAHNIDKFWYTDRIVHTCPLLIVVKWGLIQAGQSEATQRCVQERSVVEQSRAKRRGRIGAERSWVQLNKWEGVEKVEWNGAHFQRNQEERRNSACCRGQCFALSFQKYHFFQGFLLRIHKND